MKKKKAISHFCLYLFHILFCFCFLFFVFITKRIFNKKNFIYKNKNFKVNYYISRKIKIYLRKIFMVKRPLFINN